MIFIMIMSERYARMIERGDMTLMKEVAYGSMEAFEELMDRYLDLVSRTSFRIMCDRRDSEYVTVRVFLSLWHDVLDYDDTFTLGEWLLRKTCHFCRLRITRRHILNIFGVVNDVFVNVSPKADDEDDYVTKQAWELHCKVSAHMTVRQSAVYAMCVLDGMSEDTVAKIMGMTGYRIGTVLDRAEEKVRSELKYYGRDKDYCRYNAFLRKVADSLTDMDRLKKMIVSAL